MTFTLTIDMDNAAFEDEQAEPELTRLLRYVADAVQWGASPGDGGSVRDANGNTVGEWKVEA